MTKAALMKQFKVAHAVSLGGAFEGFSEYNERSTATSFHKAVQQAARAAAKEAKKKGKKDPEWFEVSRVRVLVGNPNVKVYGITITPSG